MALWGYYRTCWIINHLPAIVQKTAIFSRRAGFPHCVSQNPLSLNLLIDSINRLENYIAKSNYLGYDPYDALKSPLFRLPLFKSNKTLRFGFQQFIKRFPFNLRPLLAVPKGYNPVTLGLCIQGYANLLRGTGYEVRGTEKSSPSPFALSPEPPSAQSAEHKAQSKNAFTPEPCALSPMPVEYYLKRIDFLILELKKLIPPGYHGACWGYDFPWEARYVSIPAYQPNIVATGIIANALYSVYKITGDSECAALIKSAAHFVLNDLNRTYAGDEFIFSYSPFDRQQVFNASMKGVRILAQAYSLSGNESLRSEALNATKFVVSNQKKDGSWGYSLADKGGWTDNYHSGYILDCLHEYELLCSDKQFDENLKVGYKFYYKHFIEENGIPRFYSINKWPGDCTAAGQTILTLCRFGDKNKALKVAEWTIKNMQSPSGGFYFRKYRYHTERTSFMRWSNAWMFAALAELMTLKGEIKKADL